MGWSRFRSFCHRLLRRSSLEREMAEEFEFHLEARAEDLMARQGLTRAEALRRARIEFGAGEKCKEAVRQAVGLRLLDEARQDMLFGVRQFRRAPAFTLTVVLLLTVGVGGVTAVFSVVDAMLLRPLSYPEADRIVTLTRRTLEGEAPSAVDGPTFRFWRDNSEVFEAFAATTGANVNLATDAGTRQVGAIQVTSDYFNVLGVPPVMGRGFLPGEDRVGATPVAVLGYGAWREWFGGADDVVGRSVRLNGADHVIAGVLSADFVHGNAAFDVYLPLILETNPRAGGYNLTAIARLRPDVSFEGAQAEMQRVYGQFVQTYPQIQAGGLLGVGLASYQDLVNIDIRPLLIVLFGAALVVLLIACANVANLLVVRAAARQEEIAIRYAVGAGAGRLLRQIMTENLILSLVAGGAGAFLAYLSLPALVAVGPALGARAAAVAVDLRAFGFAWLVSIGAGLIFGATALLHVRRRNPQPALQASIRTGEGPSRARLSSTLMVAEVALTLVLLVSASLLAVTFYRLQSIQPGFTADNLWAMELAPPAETYARAAAVARLDRDLLERVARIPGVSSAAMASGAPLVRTLNAFGVIEGQAEPSPFGVEYRAVGPEYFATMEVSIVRGRAFSASDVSGSPPVVLINETLARRLFAESDPVGQHLTLMKGTPEEDYTREIVGVVANVSDRPLGAPVLSTVYTPRAQSNEGFITLLNEYGFRPALLVRSTDGAAVADALRAAVREVDPLMPVAGVRPVRQIAADSIVRQRLNMFLMTVLAGLALVLTIIGLYGVLSFYVLQRTREIGVRMALGASPDTALGQVLKRGMMLTCIGVALGLGAAFGFTRWLAGMLYGVTPTDPLILAVAALGMIATAFLACFVPAYRASRIDPMTALRCE